MSKWLYRVQAADGRGPYRPGFSKLWSDPDGPVLEPWWVELGQSLQEALAMVPEGMHSGCAFESMEALTNWFSQAERAKLQEHGFYVVRFRPHKIVARTTTQVVFSQHHSLNGFSRFCDLADREAA